MALLSIRSILCAGLLCAVAAAPLSACGGPSDAHESTSGSSDVAAAEDDWDALEAAAERRALVTTTSAPPTTTTTVPPTTTTTAPPPPPPPAPAPAAPASAPAPPPAPAPSASDAARALELINRERANAGVAPLAVSGGARSVAQSWSATMAGSGLHHNPELSGDLGRAGVTGWRAIGENVGYAGGVDQVHQMFMASSGHRANILKAAYSHVGVGVVRSGGKVWVTLDFVGY